MTEFEHARRLIREARAIVVLTGAGISAESGVPTFRGADGLWRSRRPEELATPEAFRRDPCLVWEWYGMRREAMASRSPNPAHTALARFTLSRDRVSIVTQNIDGLHTRAARDEAGSEDPSRAIPLELHGALFRDRCSRCGRVAEGTAPVDASSVDTLPRCRACGALTRPDVVWFGEPLDPKVLYEAFRKAEGADLAIVVGTSALVHPAATVPLATLRRGGALIEVNPEATPLSELAAAELRAPAGELLPELLA